MPNKTMTDIIEKYPWIKNENQKLIISPDSDGFLSALLLMNYFNAEVVGYYDCKIMLCQENVDPRECTFIDLDIFCKDIKSVGHHMVCYNSQKRPGNWYHYNNCIQPNNLRGFDCQHNFQQKYPFATIHFLLSLLETVKKINIGPQAIVPLLFSDGVCNNLFGYPENCLEWLRWLNAQDHSTLLHDIFYKEIPFSAVMQCMDKFFKERDRFNATCHYDPGQKRIINQNKSRSGHHMIISLSNGDPVNILENDCGTFDILEQEKQRTLGFINLLANLMGWQLLPTKWNFSNLKLYKFKKESMSSTSPVRLNQRNYISMVEHDCFSMAITAQTTIEYTRDIKGFFKK